MKILRQENGFTEYDNGRYIETTDESILIKFNQFIDMILPRSNQEGSGKFDGFFYDIRFKKINGISTKTISGDYKLDIYFESIEDSLISK